MNNQGKVRHSPLAGSWAKLIAIAISMILLQTCNIIQPVGGILNCFTSNMFKLNKGSMNQNYGAERANWYPQQQTMYPPNYYGQQNPMKLLFQTKWKGGLFGPKNWNTGGYKIGSPSSNLMWPGYGYSGASLVGPSMGGNPYSGYQFNEQLKLAPFTPIQPPTSSYISSPTEGWSTPVAYNPSAAPIQQTQFNNYDNAYGQTPSSYLSPAKQQMAPLIDPYGSKGSLMGYTKYPSSTTKNSYQDYYNAALLKNSPKNHTFGYTYPDWYSGVVDSPAKIAQQLMRHGLKKQYHQNRSAPLIQPTSNAQSFTILDEPRFVGYGTLEILSNKEARLSCAFNEAIDQTNKPLWIKFLGPYNSSRVAEHKNEPPFNCASSQCRTQEIESTKDYRYKFDNGPATSTLIISEPQLSDYGTYRCSALTKAINDNRIETIYQIVRFGIL